MTTELSDNERALLAREVAIDQHGYRNYGLQAFTDGWDAAMGYVKGQVRGAYEDAAIIAENCNQDDAARDEPFRIAQTIRERAKQT